jgi:hypothetical protein
MSTRSRKILFLGSTARSVHKADNLTAVCEPTVYTVWDPQHLTALQASTACYRGKKNSELCCSSAIRCECKSTDWRYSFTHFNPGTRSWYIHFTTHSVSTGIHAQPFGAHPVPSPTHTAGLKQRWQHHTTQCQLSLLITYTCERFAFETCWWS